MLKEKLYVYLLRTVLCVALFVFFVQESFKYTIATHWLVAIIVAMLMAGLITLVVKLVDFSHKRYFKLALSWYSAFAKRPMNIATVSIIALAMVPVLTILFSVSYCFIKLMALGAVYLDAF